MQALLWPWLQLTRSAPRQVSNNDNFVVSVAVGADVRITLAFCVGLRPTRCMAITDDFLTYPKSSFTGTEERRRGYRELVSDSGGSQPGLQLITNVDGVTGLFHRCHIIFSTRASRLVEYRATHPRNNNIGIYHTALGSRHLLTL